MKDAVIQEGPTVDSFFPVSDRCKEYLDANYVPNLTQLNLPICQMNDLLKTLREKGFEIEVKEQGQYSMCG